MNGKRHCFWVLAIGWSLSGVPQAEAALAANTADSLRTAWGDPDLQGLWGSGTVTPVERPKEFSDREFLTPEEGKAFLDSQVKTFQGRARREYDNVFMEQGPLVKSLRTSLIVDPPNGRLPALTAAAQKQIDANRARQKSDTVTGPEDLSLPERCIYYPGAGPGMGPEPYNSHYVIVQTKEYVAFAYEQGHLYRVISLQSRPALPESVRLWRGISQGHWDGNTLVVESSNIKSIPQATRWPLFPNTMSDENLRVTERFTRTAADTIMYQATVTDPTVYVKPWTIEYNLYPFKGPFLEVACHEGNFGLVAILSGHRAEEKKR